MIAFTAWQVFHLVSTLLTGYVYAIAVPNIVSKALLS